MIEWKGIFPALTTPFTENDELDLPLFEKNLEAQINAGVNGIIIGGSLGEASTLSINEKKELINSGIRNSGGLRPVILNIAESSTKDALTQVALAKQWNVKGLMLLPPMRYKADDRETVEYFKVIAHSTRSEEHTSELQSHSFISYAVFCLK